MLLQGILNGDTETNIEPGSRKEMLLKAILENGGGGGSGEIPVYSPTNDFTGYYDCIEGEVTDPIFFVRFMYVTHLLISNRQENGFIYYTDLLGGRILHCVSKVAEGGGKRYTEFYTDIDRINRFTFTVDAATYKTSYYTEYTFNDHIFSPSNAGVALKTTNDNVIEWRLLSDLIGNDSFATSVLVDFTTVGQSFEQLFDLLRSAAATHLGTMVTKYLPLTSEQQAMLTVDITRVYTKASQNKNVVCKMNNEMFVVTNSTADFFSAKYQEIDSSNDKLYDIEMIVSSTKVYFKCICYEATSLM